MALDSAAGVGPENESGGFLPRAARWGARSAPSIDATLAATEVATWSYDVEHDVVRADANLARFFGLPAEVVAAGAPLEAFIDRVHPEDRERVRRSFGEAFSGKERWESEHRVLQVDGSARWIIARGIIERGGDGRPLRMPGILIETTQRKAAEQAARLLADAGVALGSSLNYTKTFDDLAHLVVPRFADWCAVDLLSEAGELQRVSVYHEDPRKMDLGFDLYRLYPDDPSRPGGRALRMQARRRHYPGGTVAVASLCRLCVPALTSGDGSLPRTCERVGSPRAGTEGRACSAFTARYGLSARQVTKRDPLHRRLRRLRCLRRRSDCYRLERPFAGRVWAPAEQRRLCTAYASLR